ncbi:flavohemoglobin expression-modulating QEGLA motif protein [Microbulbifer variabilis]|uniref:flavohemoglobin expression-modulating QEGLA motif protein n=1 Tax=Microbulbifer variabilis TaxID=266805 RepID=UPI001CFD707B|nr:flavohemoglobin expression-modulating QEGLA motif protein [Microbulbifer variabilis]
MHQSPSEHPELKALDQKLFELVRGVEILAAIEPKNFREQKQAFFSTNFSTNPQFVYAEHEVDIFQRKRALYALPIEALPDEDLTELYSDIVESYVDKLDQFRSVGTGDFVYDSLRYFGEPTDKDVNNADFILHLPDDLEPSDDRFFNADEMMQFLSDFANKQGYTYDIRTDDRMIANALVAGSTVKINSHANVSETEVSALAHHELGVHLVTTLNARSQPLRVLELGCPVNTTSQEGLAILCEYLAGYLTLPRLKVLALRVVAVQSMLQDRDFKRTFVLLKEQYQVEENLAFTITTRVYRGGGFTKDYLYLQGFHQMLNALETRKDFNNLMAGKVSIECLPLISRLIDKGYLRAPQFISPAIKEPQPIDEVKRFIAHAIK